MNQASAIGASLLIAYIVFVIYKGELPCYLQVLGISPPGGAPCPSNLQPPGCNPTQPAATSSGGGTGVRPILNVQLPFAGSGGGGIGLPGGITVGIGGVGIGIGGGGGVPI